MALPSPSNGQPAARPGPAAPGAVDYGLLLFLSCLWGASFILIKVGVEAAPPATFTAMRLGFAAGALWFALWLTGARLPTDRRSWRFIVVVSMLGTLLPFFLISWGQQGIATGMTAIVMGVMPLMTMVFAHVALPDDKLTVWKSLGVVCGFFGLCILVGPEVLLNADADVLSLLAIAAAATFYGASAVTTRRMMVPSVSQIGLATAIISLAAIVMIPLAIAIDGPPVAWPQGWSLAAVACLGIVQTGFAHILMFKIVARQGPSFFAQINFLLPFLGVAWGAAIFGERLAVTAWIALALIGLGLAVSRRR